MRVNVKNTGHRTGDEVVQLYVRHPKSAIVRAIKELKGYARVSLQAGQTRTVTMKLPASALAYWDEHAHGWVLEKETVRLDVGASSADIRLTTSIQVNPVR